MCNKILNGSLKLTMLIMMIATTYYAVVTVLDDWSKSKEPSIIVDTTSDVVSTGPDIRMVDRIRDSCRTVISLTYTSKQGVDELTIYCDNVLTLENLDFGSTPYYKNKKSQQLTDTEIMDE